MYRLLNHQRQTEREIVLRHHFFKPQELYTPGNLDKFLIGLSTQPSQKVDAYFTKEVLYIYEIVFLLSVVLNPFCFQILKSSPITCLKNKAKDSVWILWPSTFNAVVITVRNANCLLIIILKTISMKLNVILGLRSYNAYREICGYKAAEDFDDLLDVFHPDVKTFKKISRLLIFNSSFITAYQASQRGVYLCG